MRFSFRGLGVVLAMSAPIFFCSCDKHHLGELPEAQKEHVDLAQDSKAVPERSTSPSETTPTPADFFPEKKSP